MQILEPRDPTAPGAGVPAESGRGEAGRAKPGRAEAGPPDPGRADPRRTMAERLLGVPLFYKILGANAIIVLVFSLLATWLAMRAVWSGAGAAPLWAWSVAGAVISIGVNAIIIQLALEPLRLLKRTADRVQEGDLDARVPESPLADRETARLMAATNRMLERMSEYRRRLRDVAARALNAAEEERRRISLELHDDASQRLAAILLRLRVARTVQDPAVKDAVLEEVRRELAETADGLRRYAQGLRPPALDELGLAAAIESHVRHVAGTIPMPIEVVADGVGRLESPEVELALYRIVQEAITNAVRHSRASRIRVAVERRNGSVTASVTDDGIGFEPERLLSSQDEDRGLGLFGMQERAEYVGGRVDVESELGSGTTVRVRVPVGV
ncbi:MAG TPA: sensor histidine kinase [Longimicrobiales bacterium]|nr:sensor histidine kinase [Longimicrobiales bacterium]